MAKLCAYGIRLGSEVLGAGFDMNLGDGEKVGPRATPARCSPAGQADNAGVDVASPSTSGGAGVGWGKSPKWGRMGGGDDA